MSLLRCKIRKIRLKPFLVDHSQNFHSFFYLLHNCVTEDEGSLLGCDVGLVPDVSKDRNAFILMIQEDLDSLTGVNDSLSKRRVLLIQRHGVTSQKTSVFGNTAARTSALVTV
jgi:hypothetical protein